MVSQSGKAEAPTISPVAPCLYRIESPTSQHLFTHESEYNHSLPFLDVLVTHSDNGFSTNLHRKKTFTGLYTNFESLSPIKYKVNLIVVLIYRAYHICSSYLSFHEQVCIIKRFLQQNRFPIYLINRVIKIFLDKQNITKIKSQNVSKLPVLILLPYLGLHGSRLKKKLNKFLGKIYPHIDLNLFFNQLNALKVSSPLRIVPRAMSALRLYINLCVVVARLLTMAKHRAIFLLGVESI